MSIDLLTNKVMICITGHRDAPDGSLHELNRWLMETYLQKGVGIHLVIGMATGFDLIAAKWASMNSVPFTAVIPFPYQVHTAMWNKKDKDCCQDLLTRAGEIVILHEDYSPKYYLERDRVMVDMCSHVVAWWNGMAKGGTAYTVKYATRKGKPVQNIFYHVG